MPTKRHILKRRNLKPKKKHKTLKKNKKKTLKQAEDAVGAVIGRGSFGCVIKPCIHLYPDIYPGDVQSIVSKIVDADSSRIELELLDDIKKIDPKGVYTSIMTENGFLTAEIVRRQTPQVQRDIIECIKKDNPINHIVINLIYVGYSLDNHFNVGSSASEKNMRLKGDIRFMKEHFKDISIYLLEGLEHFHKYGICLRDVKPENIAFGRHFNLDSVLENPIKTRNNIYSKKSKGKKMKNIPNDFVDVNNNNSNENNFELVNTKGKLFYNKSDYCKFIDFGISLNFRKDRRELLFHLIEQSKLKINTFTEEEKRLRMQKQIKKCEKELFLQELLHNPDFKISTIEESDIIIQSLFTGTLLYIPPEHYLLLMILIKKYPNLLKKKYITYQIIQTLTDGKPYSEELIFLFISETMRRFKFFKPVDITQITQLYVDLQKTPDLENKFFKGDFSDPKNILYPLIIFQDIYALGLTLYTMMANFKIVDVNMLEIVLELCNINIYHRTEVNLKDIISRIKSF